MSLHLILLLVVFVCRACATSEVAGGFLLLNKAKQLPEPLSFYLKHAPSLSPKSADEKASLVPLPQGMTAHLSELGNLSGSRLFSVRYLSDERLDRGRLGALGIVVLSSTPENPMRFVPLIVAGGTDPDTIEDYSASVVHEFGKTDVVWVRKEYSGSAHHVHRMALTNGEAAGEFRLFDPFADSDPLAALKKEGWKPWTRGNYFVEETLTFHHRLWRAPDPKKPEDGPSDRYVRVRYSWKDGKFVPGKPERDPQGSSKP